MANEYKIRILQDITLVQTGPCKQRSINLNQEAMLWGLTIKNNCQDRDLSNKKYSLTEGDFVQVVGEFDLQFAHVCPK